MRCISFSLLSSLFIVKRRTKNSWFRLHSKLSMLPDDLSNKILTVSRDVNYCKQIGRFFGKSVSRISYISTFKHIAAYYWRFRMYSGRDLWPKAKQLLLLRVTSIFGNSTNYPAKDTDWKIEVLTLMTFPCLFLIYILHFGCALIQSGGPFSPEKHPKTTGSSLKREKRQK